MKTLRTATLAMILAAASASTLHGQDGWWDWGLRELSIHFELGREGARYVPEVVHAPRVAVPRIRTGPRARTPAPPVRYEHDRRYEYEDRSGRGEARGGPPFCRNGRGHPVHGWRWCVEKGFAPRPPRYHAIRWERRPWLDLLPRYRLRPLPGTLSRGELLDALGPTVYAHLDRQAARLGGPAPLSGRWIRPGGSLLVLQVRSGPVPVAELTDLGADGWVDVVMVAGR